eukprot:364987-Chlamydomonas_euryale.AAC.8
MQESPPEGFVVDSVEALGSALKGNVERGVTAESRAIDTANPCPGAVGSQVVRGCVGFHEAKKEAKKESAPHCGHTLGVDGVPLAVIKGDDIGAFPFCRSGGCVPADEGNSVERRYHCLTTLLKEGGQGYCRSPGTCD